MNLGIIGTGLSNMITNCLILIILLIYSVCSEEIKDAIFWPDATIFKDIKEYLGLGLPIAFMWCLDMLGNVVVDIISGYISVPV